MPSGLVGHVLLDETAGQSVAIAANDKLQSGTTHGRAEWTAGKFANGIRLSEGGYVDLGQLGSFERSGGFSFGAWVKPQAGGNGAVIARMDDANAYRGYDLLVSGNRISVHMIHRWPDNAIKINTKETIAGDDWTHVFVTYDGSSKASGINVYFNGKRQEWTIEQDGLSDTIITDKSLKLGRRTDGSQFTGTVDDVQLYGRALTEVEVAMISGLDPITPLLAKSSKSWTDAERSLLMNHYLSTMDDEYKQRTSEIVAVQGEIAKAEKPISTVMVMQDLPSPRMTFILDRGNYNSPKKDQALEPATPSALPRPAPDAPKSRLGLAQWIIRPDHPLTARVAVTRFWEMFMGNGIVRTVEDFGTQGEMPSHEELLDWLAVDFVENGWDVKRFVKQLVMSNVYRQSSRVHPSLLERDPENLLYARGPRFRLQGEFVRDNALAASGLMVPTIGGPSVKPYQPPGLWEEVSIGGDQFVQDHGDKLYRRSIYTYIKRSAPPPTMQIFDAPTREKCVLRRSRTNTPLQALATMNDPQFVEASRALAERAMQQYDSLDQQISFAYRRATGLTPSAKAIESLRQTYESELAVFRQNPERATKLLAVGESPRDMNFPVDEHAAMTIVASIILNLDVTLTRS
jgi:hypothetical protein